MKQQPALTDVDTDQQENGVETMVEVDRDSASRLGLTADRASTPRSTTPSASARWRRSTRAQPVPRDHGMGAALHPGPERARRRLRARPRRPPAARPATATRPHGRGGGARRLGGARRRPSPPTRARATPRPATRSATRATALVPLGAVARFVEQPTRDLGEPPGRRARDDDLVQPRRRRDARRRARARSTQAEADIGMPTNVRGAFAGHARSRPSSRRASRRC